MKEAEPIAKCLPEDLQVMKNAVELWRKTRTKQGPMPKELWLAAAELAKKHGVTPVAKCAGLAHGTLSEHVRQANPQTKLRPVNNPSEQTQISGSRQAHFMEVITAPSIAKNQEVIIELCNGDGAQMTIRLPSGEVDLSALCTSFWSQKCCS